MKNMGSINKYRCQKTGCNITDNVAVISDIHTGEEYWCLDCYSHDVRKRYAVMDYCPLCYETKPHHSDDCLMRKLSPVPEILPCMRCGGEGGKEYHSRKKINNREHLTSHIVRCDKCYDFISAEIWPEACDCWKEG